MNSGRGRASLTWTKGSPGGACSGAFASCAVETAAVAIRSAVAAIRVRSMSRPFLIIPAPVRGARILGCGRTENVPATGSFGWRMRSRGRPRRLGRDGRDAAMSLREAFRHSEVEAVRLDQLRPVVGDAEGAHPPDRVAPGPAGAERGDGLHVARFLLKPGCDLGLRQDDRHPGMQMRDLRVRL